MLWSLLKFFFTQVPLKKFCKKMQKMKIDYVHCPMRKFWRTSLRLFGQNNVGISKNRDDWGRLHKFAQGKTRVKFCLPTLHFLMWRTEGKNGSFIAMRINLRCFRKPPYQKTLHCGRPEAMPIFQIVMIMYTSVVFLSFSNLPY